MNASTVFAFATYEYLPEDHPLYGAELKFVVQGNVTKCDPGRLYGLPEDCYPPEGGEAEDIEVSLCSPPDGVNPDLAEEVFRDTLQGNSSLRELVENKLRGSLIRYGYDD
jgi:hypothetical protein